MKRRMAAVARCTEHLSVPCGNHGHSKAESDTDSEHHQWPQTPSNTPTPTKRSPGCLLQPARCGKRRRRLGCWSPGNQAEVNGLPVFSQDVITCLYSFLDFEDMCSMKTFSKVWEDACNKPLFSREIQRRWPHDHRDIGMGAGVSPLACLGYSDWRARMRSFGV